MLGKTHKMGCKMVIFVSELSFYGFLGFAEEYLLLCECFMLISFVNLRMQFKSLGPN